MATDKTFYRWASFEPRALLALAGMRPESAYTFEAFSTKKIELEGRFDGVLVPQGAGAPLLFAEFQGYADEGFLRQWALKILARLDERGETGPVEAVVVYLRHAHQAAEGGLSLGSEARRLLSFTPRVVVLEDFGPQQLLELDEPGVLPLLPLCGLGTAEVRHRLPEWAARIRREARDEQEGTELLTLLVLFGSHRLPGLGLEELIQSIGGLVMEESRAARELVDIGRRRGLEEGRKEGLELGARALREAVLSLYEARFGTVPEAVRSQIEGTQDLDVLRGWVPLVAAASAEQIHGQILDLGTS
jgi:predicted transposase YdaD